MKKLELDYLAKLQNNQLAYYGYRQTMDGDISYLVSLEESSYFVNNGAGWVYCGAVYGMSSPEVVLEAYEILKKSRLVT